MTTLYENINDLDFQCFDPSLLIIIMLRTPLSTLFSTRLLLSCLVVVIFQRTMISAILRNLVLRNALTRGYPLIY